MHTRVKILDIPMVISNNEQPLAAVKTLFTKLNQEGIRYCHWKSNCRLEKSIRGLTDLDLLVDPSHEQQLKLILDRYDIIPIQSPPAIQYPSIEDYLGYDVETGRLFHLHLHYQLILGEHFVKNYRIPLEEAFLSNVKFFQDLVKIPVPELELAVLAIRALLKYRDRDAIKDILSIRSQGMPPEIMDEIRYLLDQTDWEKLSSSLNDYLDFITPRIVLDMLKTVVRAPRSGHLLFRLRNQLRGELYDYQRYSRWQASCIYWGATIRQLLPFIPRDRYKKTPITGGRIVAVIGADGSGKSTAIGEIGKWLSWKLKTRRYYLGSQQPSIATTLLELGFRAARKTSRVWNRLTGEKNAPARLLMSWQQFCRNIYHLSVGHDRYHRYIAARRQSAQGAIVLCDRYPLESIWQAMEGRPMDGPQIAIESGEAMSSLTRRLSDIEKNIYRKIRPPDQIFVLHVSPEVSQQRKPDHDPNMILNKSQALEQMERGELPIIDVDANLPIEQVLLQIKTALWQRL